MPAAVRLFVAVPCGEQLAQALTTALDGQQAGRFLRWTHPDTWHLTLQFLGDWPRSQVSDLVTALQPASSTEVFTLRTAGVGAFPGMKRPRVLFLQMEDDGQAAHLAALVRAKVAETWPGGPQDGRDFRPHLTLSRIRMPLKLEELKILQGLELGDLPDFPVESFTLFESHLESGRTRHIPVAEYPLRKKGEKKGLHPS